MASGLSHPMQRKTLRVAQPNRPVHVQTLRVLRVEGNICLTDWRDESGERRGDALFSSALMPAVFFLPKARLQTHVTPPSAY